MYCNTIENTLFIILMFDVWKFWWYVLAIFVGLPIAHGIMEAKVKSKGLDWQVDSVGTSGWHDGEQPDRRAISTAKKHGIDISHQKISPHY